MTTPSISPAPRPRRWFDGLQVGAFAIALIIPTIDLFVRSDEDRGPGPEFRAPAQKPDVPKTLVKLLSYPRQYEDYWNDSFGLRDVLLRWHSMVKVFGFGVSPDVKHVIGKDGWIFNDNNQLIDAWRGAIPFTQDRLEAWKRKLERRRDLVRSLGAHYVFSIAPDKPAIYPEFMPDRFNQVGPSRSDQLFEYMKAHSDVDVLDLRPALLAEKADDGPGDYVYYELGTHWQFRGGIAGYNAFVEHLKPRFPALRAMPLSMHRHKVEPEMGDTEARNMYIGDLLPQPMHRYVIDGPLRHKLVLDSDVPRRKITEVDDPRLPRVVMFHDSFGPYFENQWKETSSRLALIHDYDFDPQILGHEHPDLVIEFVVERALVFQDPRERFPHETGENAVRFLRSKNVVATLDPAHPEQTFVNLAGATLALGKDQFGPFVTLQTKTGFESFGVAGLPVLTDCVLMIYAELSMPAAGEVALHWKQTVDPRWSEQQKVTAHVVPGANEVYFELRVPNTLEGLALRPFENGAACKLRAFEIRKVEAARAR